jgi:hypothetical protein
MSAVTEKTAATECQALLDGAGRWNCDRCALAWIDGDKPPACLRTTYARLYDTAVAEAERIEQTQRALVESGIRKCPDQEQLRKAMEFLAIGRLVQRFAQTHGKERA